jgi:hypothetical protein
MSEVDLYTVQKLRGHSTMAMTDLAPNYLKKAVSMLENSISQHKESNILDFESSRLANTKNNKLPLAVRGNIYKGI